MQNQTQTNQTKVVTLKNGKLFINDSDDITLYDVMEVLGILGAISLSNAIIDRLLNSDMFKTLGENDEQNQDKMIEVVTIMEEEMKKLTNVFAEDENEENKLKSEILELQDKDEVKLIEYSDTNNMSIKTDADMNVINTAFKLLLTLLAVYAANSKIDQEDLKKAIAELYVFIEKAGFELVEFTLRQVVENAEKQIKEKK